VEGDVTRNIRVARALGVTMAGVTIVGAAMMMAVLAAAAPALAQSWPTKPVRVIVPFSPGSATDLVPRTVFDQVSSQIGQTIIIENRTGGGTTVGTAAVAKAEPDGHTALVHSNGLVTTPAIQANVGYDPVADFAAITPLGNVPMVLVISPEKKITTLKQLVDYAKANPGKLNYAAAGIGTPPHLAMERFRVAAGFTGQLVPFRGAPEALTEVLAGRVDVYFVPLPPAVSFINEGKLLPLAVSSRKRAAALPTVRTTTESGYPNSDFDFWIGMFVPKHTPRPIVGQVHREIVKGLETTAVTAKLANLGVETMIMTPEDFDARVANETRIAVELARAAQIPMQ
jgi:tripartite-type tricarboxylate transporter receptor subunit TctC